MPPLTPYFALGLILATVLVTLWHELGHLLVARMLGLPVKLITFGLGPVLWRRTLDKETQFVLRAVPTGMSIGVPGRHNPDGSLRRPLYHDLLVAAGGPLASLLLTALLLAALLAWPIGGAVQSWVIGIGLLSVLLALLNLLPIPGLDGGHLLILSAIWLGLPLAPAHEKSAHALGLRLLSTLCVALIVFECLGRL